MSTTARPLLYSADDGTVYIMTLIDYVIHLSIFPAPCTKGWDSLLSHSLVLLPSYIHKSILTTYNQKKVC